MLIFGKKQIRNTYMVYEQCVRGKRKKLRSGSLFPELIRFQRREEGVSAREAYFYRRRLGRVREICQLFTVPILPDKSKASFAKKTSQAQCSILKFCQYFQMSYTVYTCIAILDTLLHNCKHQK